MKGNPVGVRGTDGGGGGAIGTTTGMCSFRASYTTG